jgi:signal peptidase II
MKAKYLSFVLLFILALALDQGTKVWARHNLKPDGYPQSLGRRETVVPIKTVVRGYFDLRYSENPGSAFGLFRNMQGARTGLLLVGLLCLGVIGLWLYRLPGATPWLSGKLGLLAGGAIGNIYDRMMFSRVTDFIVWKYTGKDGIPHEWPTFNIADAALVIGVIAILIDWPRDRVMAELAEAEKNEKKDGNGDAPTAGKNAPAGEAPSVS